MHQSLEGRNYNDQGNSTMINIENETPLFKPDSNLSLSSLNHSSNVDLER